MTRRSLTHVLLSLLLLLSQQLAMAHVMSHWSARLAPAGQLQAGKDDGSLSRAIAQDQSCDQCLAFAQIASAVGSGARSFAPPALCDAAIARSGAAPAGACAPCPFDTRAPPANA
jgi:hypothetical protein